ncbi:Calx-beta domain-containing protein, partial [Algoriphagus zhangzhouensis]
MKTFTSRFFLFIPILFLWTSIFSQAQTTVTFDEITGSTANSLNGTNTYDNSGVRFQIFSGSNNNAYVSSFDRGFNDTRALDDTNLTVGGVTGWKIRKVDGSAFQFVSIWLQEGCGCSSTDGTVKAFKNGSQVGSTVNVTFDSRSAGAKNFVANPDFYDVDEIRIEGVDLYVLIDNFTFGAPYSPVDGDPPVVSSIALVGTPLTTATTVDYTVTFSKNAKNVTSDDFELTTVGTVGTVGAVSGSGTTYNVTVNGIDGEGTIRLDLKAGTDIANDDDVTGTPAFTLGQLHNVGECFVETFETETDEATTFSGNGLNFTLGTGLKIEKRLGFGAGPSNGYITNNFTAGTFSLSSGTEFTMKTIDLFLSDMSNGNNPTGTGTLVITGKKGGIDQFTITKTTGFPTNTAVNNGFFTLDFATDGAANYRDTNVDELVFTISGGFIELAIDNMNFCEAAPDVDADAPAVNSILKVGNPVSTSTTVDFQVTFDEDAFNVTTDDFDLVRTGTATGAITGISGSGSVYTLNVTGISGEGSIQVKLLAGTDIADDLGNTPPFEYVNGEIHLVGACYIENFETFLDGITAFTSNGVDLTLGGNWEVNVRSGFGINSSDVFVENTGSGTYTLDLSEPVRFSQIAFFLSSEVGSIINPTDDGTLTIRGISSGSTAYTITKSTGFPTNFSSNNGFFYIDFSTEGGADNSGTYVDGLEIEIGGSFVYLAMDNLQFCSDYEPPTVTLSVTPTSRSEGVATATEVIATLSGVTSGDVLVDLGFSGTATGSGVDYSLSGSQISITAGNTSGSVTLTNVPDALYEGNETVIIDITSVTNADEDGTQQVTYTIVDDDSEATVSLELLDIYNPITDESGGQAYVRAKIDAVAGVTVTVPLSFSGTATGGGTDYSITGSTITISPGQTMDSIRVTSQYDGIEEGDETVIVTMGTPTNGLKGSPDQVTITIIDEDAAPPSGYAVSIDQDPITPSNSSNVSFTFSGADIGTTYYYSFSSSGGGAPVTGSGTIATPTDQITGIDLSGLGNGTITLSASLEDEFGNEGAAAIDTSEKIASNPPTFTGLPTDITVYEEIPSNIDLSAATFDDVDAAPDDILEISYLALGGTLSFNAGTGITISQPIPGAWTTSGTLSNLNTYLSDPASIKFTSNPGVIGDNAGSIGLSGNDGLVGASFGTINIDVEQGIAFSINDVSVVEGDAGTIPLTFTVSLTAPAPAGGATVDYATSDGSAIAGSDYTAISGTLSFAVGETSKTIDLSVSGDEAVELDETLTLTLSNPTGTGIVIGDDTGTGTITNDDQATVTIADVAVNENSGTATITLTLDNAVDGGFDVDVSTADGTATTGDNDYTAVTSQTLTFAGTVGETETFNITLGGDIKVEADETVSISMSNLVPIIVSSGNIDITDGATLTITNDDQATVTIADVSGKEDDGSITLTATLDNAVDGGLTVDVSTTDGTATVADSDYSAVASQTLTFAGTEGETQTFTVTPTVDATPEPDETVLISMGNLVPTTVAGGDIDISDGAILTILNDDINAPSTPDLVPSSDSGISDSDDITNDRTPTLQGTADPNTTIEIFSSVEGSLGETTSNNVGVWEFTPVSELSPNPGVPAVSHDFTARSKDGSGNFSDSGPLTVVIDTKAPAPIVIGGLTLQLDNNGNTPSISPSDLLASPISDDYSASGDIQLTLNVNSFDCADIGPNPVRLTATDEAGNSDYAETIVFVQDIISPTIVAKTTITLNVDAFGTVILTPNMVDEGSFDNCGILTRELSQTNFDRTDEGVKNITYTVTDVNGNPSQVNIAVTIVVVPKVLNITVDAGQSKVYGDADPVFTFVADGFEAGDDETILTGALTRVAGEDVGTYSITLGTLDAGPNYTINFTGADFAITPAILDITADAGQSKVYGDGDPVFTYQYSGL